jgi:cyclopropane-fatty-acyl-phospholipid synthase
MLDKNMQYSCGYWAHANTLDEAQEAKLNLICKKVQLEKGQRVLDIGCGWGGLAGYAARHFGVSVDGYTVSKEQATFAEEKLKGLPVRIFLEDYRSINEQYDRIVSVGMFEHVGYKNYGTYFQVARKALKDDGLMVLHTIGGNVTTASTDPWIQKYIFRSSALPSVKQIAAASEGCFVMEDWHNFGADYDRTLMAWYENFKSAWLALAQTGKYTERFRRMWEYYLCACAGSFRARSIELWQIVLSPKGVRGGYRPMR